MECVAHIFIPLSQSSFQPTMLLKSNTLKTIIFNRNPLYRWAQQKEYSNRNKRIRYQWIDFKLINAINAHERSGFLLILLETHKRLKHTHKQPTNGTTNSPKCTNLLRMYLQWASIWFRTFDAFEIINTSS